MLGNMLTSHLYTNDIISENIDVLKAENSVLRKQLQSKVEAVSILQEENRKLGLKAEEKLTQEKNEREWFSFSTSSIREKNATALYKALREKYTHISTELEEISLRYEDAQEDLRILRREKGNIHQVRYNYDPQKYKSIEDTLGNLENMKVQNSKLKLDIQSLLDEKEDLLNEKSQLEEKNVRLCTELQNLLSLEPDQSLDVDHLIMENRSLLQQIQRLREEKELANNMGRKYKEAWEKTRLQVKKDPKLGAEQQRLFELLDGVTFPVSHPVDLTSVEGLTGLAISLLETLQDRQIQMRHLRSNNRDLAGKLLLLEDAGSTKSKPTQILLQPLAKTNSSDEMDFDKLTVLIQTKLEEKASQDGVDCTHVESIQHLKKIREQAQSEKEKEEIEENVRKIIEREEARNKMEEQSFIDENKSERERREMSLKQEGLQKALSGTKTPDILSFISRVAVHPTEEPENYIDEDDLEIININQL